jgi:hypothetical protein
LLKGNGVWRRDCGSLVSHSLCLFVGSAIVDSFYDGDKFGAEGASGSGETVAAWGGGLHLLEILENFGQVQVLHVDVGVLEVLIEDEDVVDWEFEEAVS